MPTRVTLSGIFIGIALVLVTVGPVAGVSVAAGGAGSGSGAESIWDHQGEDEPEPHITQQYIYVTEGGVAEVTVDLGEAENATLQIGYDDTIHAYISVADGTDNDSTVTVRINTFATSEHDAAYSVLQNTSRQEEKRDRVVGPTFGDMEIERVSIGILDTSGYRIQLRTGVGTNGEVIDDAALVVDDRSHRGVTLFHAAKSLQVDQRADMQSLVQQGVLKRERATQAGLLAVRWNAGGVRGLVAARGSGQNQTERVLSLFGGESAAYDFDLQTRNDRGNLLKRVSGALRPSTTSVVYDPGTDRYWLLIDPLGLSAQIDERASGRDYRLSIRPNDGELPDNYPADKSDRARFRITRATANTSLATSGWNLTVTGETTLPPRANVSFIFVQDENSTIAPRPVSVRTNQTVRARYEIPRTSRTHRVALRGPTGDLLTASQLRVRAPKTPTETPTTAPTGTPTTTSTATPTTTSTPTATQTFSPTTQPTKSTPEQTGTAGGGTATVDSATPATPAGGGTGYSTRTKVALVGIGVIVVVALRLLAG